MAKQEVHTWTGIPKCKLTSQHDFNFNHVDFCNTYNILKQNLSCQIFSIIIMSNSIHNASDAMLSFEYSVFSVSLF